MRRVAVWGLALSGILVLSLAGLLESAGGGRPMNVAVIVTDGSTDYRHYFPDTQQYAQVNRFLFERQGVVASADGLWTYIHGHDTVLRIDQMSGLLKVRLDGRVVEEVALPSSLNHLVWSADRTWFVYLGYDPASEQSALMKQSAHSQTREVIMLWPFGLTPNSMVISPDGRQLAFSVVTAEPNNSSVFIVPISGGTPQNVTEGLVGDYRLVAWTAPDEWLLTMPGFHYVAMRPDGTDLQRLLPDVNYLIQAPIEWVAYANLGIIRAANYQVFGVRIGEDTPRWSLEGIAAITPDEQFVVYRDTNDGETLWKLPIEGGAPEKIATLPSMDLGLQISPDGRYALIATYTEDYAKLVIQRVDLQDGTVTPLYTQTDNRTGEFRWSPDSTWVSLHDRVNSGGNWVEQLVIMQADGNQRQTLNFTWGYPEAIWQQGPPLDFASRALILMGAGLVGLSFGIALVRSRKNS